jgi:hypothetical protein
MLKKVREAIQLLSKMNSDQHKSDSKLKTLSLGILAKQSDCERFMKLSKEDKEKRLKNFKENLVGEIDAKK